jgi:hypothetical protein
VSRKILKNFLIFLLIFSGFLIVRLVFAQDFGTEAVNTGLGGSLSQGDPRTIIGRIINIVLGFLGVIALILIIYAGFLWMTSEGNEEKVAKAKKTLISAVIGLLIILASWGIATFLINRLSGATSGNVVGQICIDGETIPCGCGGIMYCIDGSWGACVGSNCFPGGPGGPTNCDSSPNPGCQANDDICDPSYYCDENCICQPKGSIGDSCDRNPETPTCDADNSLCGEFLSCDEETCTCFGPPVITGINPVGGFCQEDKNKSCKSDTDCELTCNKSSPNGAMNNLITILGSSFGEYEESVSKVIFSNNRLGRNPIEVNPVCVNFWSDNQIIIAVPNGISDGPIRIIRFDGAEDTTDNDYGPKLPNFIANNIVRPGLCAINPTGGSLGTELSYQGINLYSGEAYFGNYQSNIQALESDFSHPSSLSGQASIPNIRAGETGTFVISQIGGNQEASNYIRVFKEADPNEGAYIVSFSPERGRSGQYVTITGNGFGGARGSSRVYFGDKEANYDFPAICARSIWTDNQIVVKVPEDINNGSYFIKISINDKTIDTSQLNPNVFQIDDSLSLKTSLCKLEPEQGTIATPVKLYGEYFGEVNREGLVRFNSNKNISGIIEKENDADVILVPVPEGAITGPVKIIKNDQWGNELNFEVGNCVSNEDCPGQICCPQNTYKKGRCADSLRDCLIDIPTSVFEWNFSTGFSGGEVTDPTESCTTLGNYFGACPIGTSCPNVPGICSLYTGGFKKVVGECDYSCASVEGCGGLGSSTCTYNKDLNRCVKDGNDGLCSLPRIQTFIINEQEYEFNLTCNQDGNWQLTTNTSCPDGWERGINNTCVDKGSICDLCAEGLNCQQIGAEGRCVSGPICPTNSVCEDNPDISSSDNCVILDNPSCDCCCRIGNSAEDCCVPLECAGTCGQDEIDDGVGFGFCSGCADAGTTQAEHDAACNCFEHSGQYCSITSEHPEGICTDCSGIITKDGCDNHNTVCCFDTRQTASPDDDICRGGSGVEISNNPDHPDFGYCAYYNCDIEEPSLCASSTPYKIGFFKNVYDCEEGCAQSDGDICSLFDGRMDDCTEIEICCFDFETDKCKSGEQINEGENIGYCAYYNCGDPAADPPEDPNICLPEPKTSGTFTNFNICDLRCSSNDGGSGKDCISRVSLVDCNFDICSYPGMDCLTETGSVASDISDCGVCCCNPANSEACQTEAAPNLYCQPNVGKCIGEDRGLCCGCEKDSDCGNDKTLGCDFEACCQARPEVIESLPKNNEDDVCRNAVVRITFDQLMDFSSFNSNILLLQEMDYGSGVCPTGTFVYENEDGREEDRGIVKVFKRVKLAVSGLFNKIFSKNSRALADLPDPNKLYCATPINVSAENMKSQTIINILPKKLLAPATNYFLVVKGDEELNSQTGIISILGIGLNGEGLEHEGSFTEGVNLKFNNNIYKNSHIIQFRTLSDKESNSGVCAISSIGLNPYSYLFQTTDNSLDENDNNPQDKTFDTESDRDKVFTAWAYSADNQVIQPVTGYFWEWDFDIIDESIATIKPVTGLGANKAFLNAETGITDGETKLFATVNMERFLGGSANPDPSCTCSDEICSSNCLNAFSEGDNFTSYSNIYIFICNNPWPPVNDEGTWQPWLDNCDSVINGNCTDFSYKFYYCRDAGSEGTFDDLPAISNQAVIRGESAILSCSSDNSPCSNLNDFCGQDRNGDGIPDGICVWSVLKESYFFREEVLPPGEIMSAVDTKVGGEVLLTWRSSSDQVASYKIYYGELGRAISNSKEFSINEANCQLSGEEYSCQAAISNLENENTYIFRLSVISENEAESVLSNEKTATPTDQTPPLVPTNFILEDLVDENIVRFSWEKADNSALFYRLYRGIQSGLYGESFDSANNVTSISLNKSSLSTGANYFTVSALDSFNNESAKSQELSYYYE